MAYGPSGDLFVTEDIGAVVLARPASTSPTRLDDALPVPLGLAWSGGELYVSGRGSVTRLEVDRGKVIDRKKTVADLPYGLHQQNNIVAGPNGRLYIGSGSTCNACKERDARSAAILSVLPNGRDLRIVANGLRNPFGLGRV